MFFNNVRLGFSALRQLLLYGIQPSCPPWSYCLLLPGSRAQASGPGYMRRLCRYWVKLFCSHSPLHQDMIAQMPFLQWLTLYEPIMIADACNFEDRVSAKVKVRANADGVEVGLTLTPFALLMGQTKGVCSLPKPLFLRSPKQESAPRWQAVLDYVLAVLETILNSLGIENGSTPQYLTLI